MGSIKDKTYHSRGGPEKLKEMIKMFLNWIEENDKKITI
jgi:hypothetical protein